MGELGDRLGLEQEAIGGDEHVLQQGGDVVGAAVLGDRAGGERA